MSDVFLRTPVNPADVSLIAKGTGITAFYESYRDANSNTNQTLYIPFPKEAPAGSLLILVLTHESNNSAPESISLPVEFPSLWAQTSGNSQFQTYGWYHIVGDNEPEAIELVCSGATSGLQSFTYAFVRVDNWHGSQPPEVGTIANNPSTSTADPPAVTASWGAEATNLFVAVAMTRSAAKTASGWPTNYIDRLSSRADFAVGLNAHTGIHLASRITNTATENPSAFTLSGGVDRNMAITIAIRGLAADDTTGLSAFSDDDVADLSALSSSPEDYEFASGPPDDSAVVATDDDYQVAAYGDDDLGVFAVLDLVCADPASAESVSTPPDDDADVELPRPVFADDDLPFIFANDDWSPEWSQGPPDQDDERNASSFDDDTLPTLREILADPADFEFIAGPVAFPDDETGETTGASSFDDVYPLPDPADEHAAFVTSAVGDETGETTGAVAADDVYPLPDDADEFVSFAPDFDEEAPFAASADDVHPLPDPADEHTWAGASFPDDETGETTGGAAFDDDWIVPAPDVAEDFESFGGPLDDAPVAVDDSIFLAASDDDEIAAAFIPPAAEEHSQVGTPEDDPNFAVPFPASADDVHPLPDPADEHTGTPPDQDDTAGQASADDVYPLPEAADEHTGAGIDQDDQLVGTAADDVFDLPAAADEHTATPVEDTPLEALGVVFDDVYPIPDPADEHTATPPDQDDTAGSQAADDVFDLPPDAEEHTAGPSDDLIAEASILATSFDDDQVYPDFVLTLAEPTTWSTPPIIREPNPAVDGVRIFEQARASFGKHGRQTEFGGSRRTEFMPSRVTEFEAPDRRTVFRSRLIVEGELTMTVLRNDLERTQKRTTENPSFVFNFAKFVNRNVTVASISGINGGVTLGVTSVQKNVVPSTNLVVTGATFVGQQVAAFFDAGTDSEDYDVYATALMSDGQRLTVAGIIEVRNPT